MRVSVRSVPGVDTVKVSLQSGVASIALKPGNTVTLKQLQEAVTKNGFTMKSCLATVAGTLQAGGDNAELHISGSNDVLKLKPAKGASPTAPSMNGKTVTITGTIPEAQKGTTPSAMEYQGIEVQP